MNPITQCVEFIDADSMFHCGLSDEAYGYCTGPDQDIFLGTCCSTVLLNMDVVRERGRNSVSCFSQDPYYYALYTIPTRSDDRGDPFTVVKS